MASAIPAAISGIGGIFQGIGASKPKTSTSTFDSSGTQTAELDPKQRKINKSIFQQLLKYIQAGPTVQQADRNTQRAQINQGFNAANTNLEANLAARGMSSGGKYGAGVNDNLLERQKQTQAGEAGLQRDAWSKFMQMLGFGQAFDQPRTFTTQQSGTQTGSQSGMPWQSAVGGGLSDLSSYLYLRNMNNMGGGSGGSGGGINFPMIPGYSGYCAVAIELWGAWDTRTMLVRCYLKAQAARSLKWRAGVAVYRLTGRHIARLIRWNRPLRRACEKLFAGLAVRALNS